MLILLVSAIFIDVVKNAVTKIHNYYKINKLFL